MSDNSPVKFSRKHKILILLTYPKSGGTELTLLNLLKNYKKNNLIFDICFLDKKNELSDDFEKNSNKVFHLSLLNSNVKLIINILKILMRNRYEIILSFGLKPNLIARLIKIFFPSLKIINNLRSIFSGDSENIFHTKIDFITSILMDEYWVNSAAGIEYLLKNNFNKSKLKLFYNGIDTTAFDHIEKTAPDSIKYLCKNKIVITNIGNLRLVKNQEFIINVVKRIVDNGIKNIIVLIIGEGVLYNKLQEKINNLHLNDFVKLLSREKNIVSILKCSDIFLFTSFYEGLPNAVLEAAAVGLPIVSSDAGGTKEIVVDGKGGYIITDFNVDIYAEKITELINSNELRKNFGDFNKKYIRENFNFANMINRFDELLNNLFKPIKIIRIIARLNVGGPAKHTIYLTKFLNNENYKTTLVTGYVEDNEEDMSYFANENNVKPVYVKNMHRSLSLKDDLLTIFEIIRIILKEKPDIVHSHTAKAGTVGRIAALIINIRNFFLFKKRIKIFHTFHGHTFHSYHSRIMTKIFILIEKFLTKFCTDKVIVLSEQQYDEIVFKFKIGKPEKFIIIPLGFDFSEFNFSYNDRLNFRKKYNIDSDAIVVAIIGRITRVKNHFRFLNIVKIFVQKYPLLLHSKKIIFSVIGGGELLNDLKIFAEKNNLNNYVIFTENITDTKLIYAGIDILALTSDNEGTPLTILEAFYCKKPVISTAVGGVIDLLKNEKGFAINKDDNTEYADKLKELIVNDDLRNKFIERGAQYVMNTHSLQSLVNNILKLYFENYKNNY